MAKFFTSANIQHVFGLIFRLKAQSKREERNRKRKLMEKTCKKNQMKQTERKEKKMRIKERTQQHEINAKDGKAKQTNGKERQRKGNNKGDEEGLRK